MKTEPATKFPDGPAKPLGKQAAKDGVSPSGRGLKLTSGSGSQKSLNPKKGQPNTMRYLGH